MSFSRLQASIISIIKIPKSLVSESQILFLNDRFFCGYKFSQNRKWQSFPFMASSETRSKLVKYFTIYKENILNTVKFM